MRCARCSTAACAAPPAATVTASALADGDTATSSVIERAYLPNDAHSFTKYYDGDDTRQADAVRHRQGGPARHAAQDQCHDRGVESRSTQARRACLVSSITAFPNDEWVQLTAPERQLCPRQGDRQRYRRRRTVHRTSATSQPINIFVAPGTSPVNAVTTEWRVTNIRTRGITICNTTDGGSSPQTAVGDQHQPAADEGRARQLFALERRRALAVPMGRQRQQRQRPPEVRPVAYPDPPSRST